LLELALHLETKEQSHERWGFLESHLTWRSAWAALWGIAARGFFSAGVLQSELPRLAADVANARPDEIVAVLTHVPPTLVASVGQPSLLRNYPLVLDALLMHAAHRAPEALEAARPRLPENVRRALPLVRRRLGLEPAAHHPELFADLVETHVTTWGTGDHWVLREGALVAEPLERVEQVASMAALLAPRASLEEAIAAAASGRARDLPQGWRLGPIYVRATTEQMFAIVESCHIDHEQLLLMFASRKDRPQALLSLLEREQAKDGSLIEWLAVIIARRLHEEGERIPGKLDELVDFRCAPRMYDHPAWATYVAGLRAFPRERLLSRADTLAASEDEDAREDSVVALRAHPDDARLQRAARDPERARVIGSVGPDAIPVLRDALRSAPRGSDLELYLSGAITDAMVAAPEIEPQWDEAISPVSSQFTTVLARLPRARREAVVRAHLDDQGNQQIQRVVWALHLLGDDALKEALAKILARDKRPELKFALSNLGARATQPLVELLAGAPPDQVRDVVDRSRLPDDIADRLLGREKHRSLPIVRGSIADGARFLALVEPHLRAATPVFKLRLTGERIAIGEYVVAGRSVLDRSVPLGEHPVTTYYKENGPSRQEGPTAGLEAVMVRFGEARPATWVEAQENGGGPALGNDELQFWLGDEARIATDEEAANTALEAAGSETYLDGVSAAELGGDGDDEFGAVVVYVGELCRLTRAFWALDGDGAPVALVAAFEYPNH
jgi:hypothetical protein